MSKLVPKTIGLSADQLSELDRRAAFLNRSRHGARQPQLPGFPQWKEVTYAVLVRHAIAYWTEATASEYRDHAPKKRKGGKRRA